MRYRKGEKGDISLATAIIFGALITVLVFMLLNSVVSEGSLTKRDQARDQVINAAQMGVKNVLSVAHFVLQTRIPEKKVSQITQTYLSDLLPPSSNSTSTLAVNISNIYNQTKQVDPTTAYTILNYSFSLASYTTNLFFLSTKVSYTYVYTITSKGYKTTSNPNLSLTITATGKIEGSAYIENFARYALFTDKHTMADGTTKVWFTSDTRFYGPVHTNGRFAFADNPFFSDEVSSAENDAYFYHYKNGNTALAANSYPPDVPTFQAGFTRGAQKINLPESTNSQLISSLGGDPVNDLSSITSENTRNQYIRRKLGLTVNNNPPSNGIYTQTIVNGGGIFVQGDASIQFGKDNQGRAVYTITQGSTTSVFTIDTAQNKTYVKTGTNTIEINAIPNGVIYVNGATDSKGNLTNGTITSVSGTIQKDQAITLVGRKGVTITNHIKYEDDPINNRSAKNILGILAEEGDIIVDPPRDKNGNPSHTDADPSDPDLDFEIDAVLMSPKGVVQVKDYNSRTRGGSVILKGGIISKNYGAFGTFSNINKTGYGREFYYDYRMKEDYAPPSFPTTGRTIYTEGTVANPKWLKIDKWEEKWE
ncbi:MAG TPA: DUF4900 domain-containing protein [Dictyoglomaceae bacterium]|nr:DUF4900 domain-containing protein [Dictyoglomaceae bacterium]